MPLKLYHKKRNFTKTKEPKGHERKKSGRSFVVQEHHATRLHFDFRLEMEGVMKSWAVPKGPSMNPKDKHLAVMVEDHPIEYSSFQGAIPEGEYGAGEVRRWDYGTYEPIGDLPIEEQLENGKLTFILKGKKLKGEFHMIEMKGRIGDEGKRNWLMFKHEDEYADPDWTITQILNYGSRSQSPSRKNKSDLGAKVLEQLVNSSKTRKRKTSKTKTASRPKTKTAHGPKTKKRGTVGTRTAHTKRTSQRKSS